MSGFAIKINIRKGNLGDLVTVLKCKQAFFFWTFLSVSNPTGL
jgi:hypothetical protein